MVKDGGIVTALDLATGQVLKEGRATGAGGKYYASPTAADGKVFVASVDGKVTVLKAGAQWDVLGVNDLGDEIYATPALAGGRIYVRTRGTLYCFGAPRADGGRHLLTRPSQVSPRRPSNRARLALAASSNASARLRDSCEVDFRACGSTMRPTTTCPRWWRSTTR